MGKDRKEAAAPAEQGPATPELKLGKVQKQESAAASTEEARTSVDTEGKNRVVANPVLRGDVALPTTDEDGNPSEEVFEAGKVHFVSDEAMKAEYLGTPLFVEAPDAE